MNKVILRSQGNLVVLDLSEVNWIEAKGRRSLWYCLENEYLVNVGIQKLEDELNPGKFLRVHRSYIINVEKIRQLTPDSKKGYEIILENGTKLPWSQHYKDRFRNLKKKVHLIPPEATEQ
jgi:two-component system, LytTR family, response regulator